MYNFKSQGEPNIPSIPAACEACRYNSKLYRHNLKLWSEFVQSLPAQLYCKIFVWNLFWHKLKENYSSLICSLQRMKFLISIFGLKHFLLILFWKWSKLLTSSLDIILISLLVSKTQFYHFFILNIGNDNHCPLSNARSGKTSYRLACQVSSKNEVG